MTIVRANVGAQRLLPEGGAAPPEYSGRFALPWREICLFAFWGTFASTLVAVAWLSLIPRQYSFDTGGARQIWRLGTRVYEAQFAGRLPPGCLVGCSGFQLTKVASAEEVVREPGRFWIDAEHGIVRWSPLGDPANGEGPIPVAVLVVPGRTRGLAWEKSLVVFDSRDHACGVGPGLSNRQSLAESDCRIWCAAETARAWRCVVYAGRSCGNRTADRRCVGARIGPGVRPDSRVELFGHVPRLAQLRRKLAHPHAFDCAVDPPVRLRPESAASRQHSDGGADDRPLGRLAPLCDRCPRVEGSLHRQCVRLCLVVDVDRPVVDGGIVSTGGRRPSTRRGGPGRPE